jgi:hypothetical protein
MTTSEALRGKTSEESSETKKKPSGFAPSSNSSSEEVPKKGVSE